MCCGHISVFTEGMTRFGPDVLHWQDCTTMRDYLRRGLMNWLLRHVMTGAALFLFSVVGKRSPVAAVCICSFSDGRDRSDVVYSGGICCSWGCLPSSWR